MDELTAYLDWYAAHWPELSAGIRAQATYCKFHVHLMIENGGECPAPLLVSVQADFHRLEELRQSVSEGVRIEDCIFPDCQIRTDFGKACEHSCPFEERQKSSQSVSEGN